MPLACRRVQSVSALETYYLKIAGSRIEPVGASRVLLDSGKRIGGHPPHVPSQAVDLEPDGSGGNNQR